MPVHQPDKSKPNMSTTLVPPTYYVVKPRGQAARIFLTTAQAATAIVGLGPTPTAVSAITGRRTRTLTHAELRELRQHVRAHHLASDEGKRPGGRPGSAGAVVDPRHDEHRTRRVPKDRHRDAPKQRTA